MSVFKANARLTFANDIKTTAQQQKFLVAARVERGPHHTAPTLPIKRGGVRLPADPNNSIDARSHSVTLKREFSKESNDWDFLTRCGHGFVSAIVSGVELDAVIDTSNTKSEELVKATGSAEVDVLGGLISGSASLDSDSEVVKTLRKSNVAAFVSGGEDYQLPGSIDELKRFTQNLAKLTEEKPRPLRIAITPYSKIVPEGRRELFGTAESLQTLVYAYFFAKDANDRISGIIDIQSAVRADEKFLVPQETQLYERSTAARNTMRELASVIAECRSKVASENQEISKGAGTTAEFPSIEALYLQYAAAERRRESEHYKAVREMLKDERASAEDINVPRCVLGSVADDAVNEVY